MCVCVRCLVLLAMLNLYNSTWLIKQSNTLISVRQKGGLPGTPPRNPRPSHGVIRGASVQLVGLSLLPTLPAPWPARCAGQILAAGTRGCLGKEV